MGSVLANTTPAVISSPDSRRTPAARPASTRMRATGASVRISTPRSRAEAAMAWVIEPMPPFASAQAPRTPSISPTVRCSRLSAPPGWLRVMGLAMTMPASSLIFKISLSK